MAKNIKLTVQEVIEIKNALIKVHKFELADKFRTFEKTFPPVKIKKVNRKSKWIPTVEIYSTIDDVR